MASDTEEWRSVVDIEEFIIISVRERLYLYDASRKDYKDVIKRENAFQAIGDLLKMQGRKGFVW